MTKDQILSSEYSFRFDEIRKQNLPLVPPELMERFDEIRKNMMVVSHYKYGPMKENYDDYKCMDALGNIEKRIIKYRDSKNTEFLADVANFAMIEFMYPSVPNARYQTTDISLACTQDLKKIRNNLDTIEYEIDEYRKSGNTALLTDIANLAFQEFVYPAFPGASYIPTDNDACEIAGFSVNEIKRYV